MSLNNSRKLKWPFASPLTQHLESNICASLKSTDPRAFIILSCYLLSTSLSLSLISCLADVYADDYTNHASGKSKPETERKLQSDTNNTDD